MTSIKQITVFGIIAFNYTWKIDGTINTNKHKHNNINPQFGRCRKFPKTCTINMNFPYYQVPFVGVPCICIKVSNSLLEFWNFATTCRFLNDLNIFYNMHTLARAQINALHNKKSDDKHNPIITYSFVYEHFFSFLLSFIYPKWRSMN